MQAITTPAARPPKRSAIGTPPRAPVDRREPDSERPKPRKPSRAMRLLMRGWSAAERKAAQKVIDFIECECVHIEGDLAGERFLLEQWQEKIVRELFGRLRENGSRRYRTAYIEIPRKNGKTSLCAALALYLLAEDNEAGAQVYSAGIQKSQGAICHDAARTMVEMNPRLMAKILPFRQYLETAPGHLPGKAGRYSVLTADNLGGSGKGKKLHGFNVSAAVLDEWHTQPKGSKVWDVIKTGTGSRRQPMILVITTSGDDKDTPCGEMHEKAAGILAGKIKDDSFYAVIFAASEKKDNPKYWQTEEAWREANPNLGVSVHLDYLREQCEEAVRNPAYESTFRQLHLNQWTTVRVRWMPMDLWAECGVDTVQPITLRAHRACSGLDLGICRDLSAHVLVFPRRVMRAPGPGLPEAEVVVFEILCRFFMPEDRLKEMMKRDGQPYDRWAREGWLTLTAGNIISFREIRESILDDHKLYKLRDLAYDRYLAAPMMEELQIEVGEKSPLSKDDQLSLWPFGQGFVSMSDPTRMLLELVRAKRIRHGSNPILTWMMDCVTIATKDGNIKPVKPDALKHAKRIDGVVALIMGLARALLYEGDLIEQGGKSVYETGQGLTSTRQPEAKAA